MLTYHSEVNLIDYILSQPHILHLFILNKVDTHTHIYDAIEMVIMVIMSHSGKGVVEMITYQAKEI